MKRIPLSKALLAATLCASLVFMATPQSVFAKSSKKTSKPAEKENAANKETVQAQLEKFAQVTLTSINKHIIPSATKKAVISNPDGTFTARYVEVDLRTVQTSYKTPESSKAVTYIGFMTYIEKEYACTAPSREAAIAGPFKQIQQKPLTELIKYQNGKWTY